MNNFPITQFGKPLAKSKYKIDLENKVFSSYTEQIVLDFSSEDGWTFKTGSNCTFKTGSDCSFNTGSYCSFNTGQYCTFKSGPDSIFRTKENCILLSWIKSEIITKTLTKSNYVCLFKQGLIEIKDKNAALLNIKHENKLIRNLCKEILNGD